MPDRRRRRGRARRRSVDRVAESSIESSAELDRDVEAPIESSVEATGEPDRAALVASLAAASEAPAVAGLLVPGRDPGDFILRGDDDASDEHTIGDVPLLLLPVRLETRFRGGTLHLRIYPDQIHHDEHAPELSAAEHRAGARYWARRAEGDEPGARAALFAELEARRAVWVARQTRPAEGADGELGERRPAPGLRRGPAIARAACLPRRWAVLGWVDGRREILAFGRPIPDRLRFEPDLGGSAGEGSDGAAWMVDYDRAVEVGMALSIDVAGIDFGAEGMTLLVLGLCPEGTGSEDLERLLEAHRFTDGLELLAQGTPTNSIDSAASAHRTRADGDALFEQEIEGGEPVGAESNAGRLAAALGLPEAGVLSRVAGGARDEDAQMAAMNRVLWSVTWGRYLDDLLAPEDGPSIVPAATRRFVREHFVDWVRGGAPLGVLSVGDQPYGVLPIRMRSGGDPAAAEPLDALEGILLRLRERWRSSLPSVPRLDPVDGGADDATLGEIVGSLPHPIRFVIRRLTWQFGLRTGLWKLLWDLVSRVDSDLALLGYIKHRTFWTLESIDEEIQWLEDLTRDPESYGIAPEDVDDAVRVLEGFIAMCEQHRDRQDPLDEWYPDAFSGVFDDSVTDDPKIFYSDYGTATDDALFSHPLVAPDGDDATTHLRAAWTRIMRGGRDSASRTAPGATSLLGQLVDAAAGRPDDDPAGFTRALEQLFELAPPTLELRLRETLGLATHRLDAWITSLDRREAAEHPPAGALRLGGFGWVERLRPDGAGGRESDGFIHAPSLSHATTAAVLRAGWRAHGDDDPASLMAVDLRSERVRGAATVLDGVRQGQALGDILGSGFERALHDAGIDLFIDDCRRRVLEARGDHRDPRGPVDGLELAALYRGGGVRVDVPEGDIHRLEPGTTSDDVRVRKLGDALDGLLTAMDAVADTLAADSLHHLLEGNLTRASASLDALATGAVAPPELQSFEPPRPGAGITHRVMALLSDEPVDAGWGSSPIAALEPAVEAWLRRRLGSPASARLAVVGADVDRASYTLADLVEAGPFGALEAVWEGPSGWARRAVVHHARQLGVDPGTLTVELEGDAIEAELAEGERPAAELGELAAELRACLAGARPLEPADLLADGELGALNAVELEARIESLLGGASSAFERLEEVLGAEERDPDAVDLAALLGALDELSRYGIAAALTWGGASADTQTRRARAVAKAVEERLTKARALAAPASDDLEARAAVAVQRARALLGDHFPLVPSFEAAPDVLRAALGDSDLLLEDDPVRALTWLGTIGRVREATGHLDAAIALEQLHHGRATEIPRVAQLPSVHGERWVALHPPDDRRRSRAAYWILGAERTAAPVLRGLVFDEWVEIVPTRDVVTGVALHHDAPTSRPPQTWLLALPGPARGWTLQSLADTAISALEAAKLRAIDPDVLLAHGHQAPAIFTSDHLDPGPQDA